MKSSKRLSILFFLTGLCATAVHAQDAVIVLEDNAVPRGKPVMVTLTGNRLEPLKDFNGANGGPALKDRDSVYRRDWFHPLQIPIVRAHDVALGDPGLYPCDLDHIFPIENADPSDRNSYDFAASDAWARMIQDYGCAILWRLGPSIEHTEERHYEVNPPQNYKTWAQSAVNVINHYTQGLWDGYRYDIRYWEIWNEPDNRHCWSGTMDEFIDFYITVSRYIKEKCPWVKVGGPAFTSGREETCKPFIEACAQAGAPLDFFSYHWYTYPEGDHGVYFRPAERVRRLLDEAGYKDTELFFDEWHPISGWKNVKRHLSHDDAVLTGSTMMGFQDSPIDKAFFYSAAHGEWGYYNGHRPEPVYYVAKAMGELRGGGTRVEAFATNIPDGSRILASEDAEGNVTAVLALYKAGRREITFDFSACGNFDRGEVLLFDQSHHLDPVAAFGSGTGKISVSTQCNSSLLMLRLRKAPSGSPDGKGLIRLAGDTRGTWDLVCGGNDGPGLKNRSRDFREHYFAAMKVPVTRVSNECRENSGLRLISTNQIFPLEGADPSNRKYYDFRASDDFVSQIKKAGTDVFWCLSPADERLISGMHFKIAPPDVSRWKVVCENIIRHYNKNKWDGFSYGIKYWEIWDAPDHPHYWGGTFEAYCSLYAEVSKYLKGLFPEIKVGGPCLESLDLDKARTFLSCCKKEGAPLDFFSYKLFHYEDGDFDRFADSADSLRTLLDGYGYDSAEIVISAWHPSPGGRDQAGEAVSVKWVSLSASLVMAWADKPVDLALFESVADRSGGVYSLPKPNGFYDMFRAFHSLGEHPARIPLALSGLSGQSRALAGKDRKGNVEVLVAISEGGDHSSVVLDLAEAGPFQTVEVYVMDAASPSLEKRCTLYHAGPRMEIPYQGTDSLLQIKLYR